MNDRQDAHIAAWVALLLFAVYLLSFSGQLYSQDSMVMVSVTESFVKRGEFNTDQMWTVLKARGELGPDGEGYAKYGYGMSLFAIPLYALALILPDVGLMQTTLLTGAVVIALSAALVYLSTRELNFSRGVGLGCALLFGLCTPAWVYVKQFWSETYALFSLVAAFYFLLRFRREPRGRDALIAGIALGLAVATRVTNVALAPLLTWYGFDRALREARVRRGLIVFALVIGLLGFSIASYNWIRFGNPLSTGYRADETFSNPLWLGAYGLLFSPGKGLFVYVPFLIALVFAFPLLFQRARRAAVLVAGVFAFYLLLFSTWYYWWGGTNWSPRFLVPTIPFLVLATAPAVELALAQTRRTFSFVFAGLCLLSFTIEVIGMSVPALAYRRLMLRVSANPEGAAIFLPEFSPLVGYFNHLKPSALDFAWLRVVNGIVQVDWLVVLLAVALIAFCGVGLRAAARGAADSPARSSPEKTAPRVALGRAHLILALVAAVALSGFSMYRYRADPRSGGSDGYHTLLEMVRQAATARDVMLLNDDTRTPFFFNENRARVRWYGLSRDPQQWDDATRSLLERLSRQYDRVWFAFDDAVPDAPDPTRAWLEQNLRPLARTDFGDGAHLILFASR